MTTRPIEETDLQHVLQHARSSFEGLRGARVFVSGGTGFFGHWLVESLLYANEELDLGVGATLLTRNAARFRETSPQVAGNDAIELIEGDVASFRFPNASFTHVIHAATDSGGRQASATPESLADAIVNGTKRVLHLAEQCGANRFLYTSSGAVYGRSTALPHTPESYIDQSEVVLPARSYEEAKRAAELQCFGRENVGPVVARCFAFVGPYLPLDQHFAIGNFIGAAIRGETIHIKGDGTPRRSWMYMADLAVWLWTLLVRGEIGQAYNVGSDDGMTIASAARLTAKTLRPGAAVQIDGVSQPGAALNSYVPDVTLAREKLGLDVRILIEEALRRTAAWHGYQRSR